MGTSGIVEPMSEQALVDTIAVELRQAAALGAKRLILTPGNYGEDFLRENQIAGDAIPVVKCSNFIGDALDIASTHPFEEILLVGHIGKLVKLAGGVMNTHSPVCGLPHGTGVRPCRCVRRFSGGVHNRYTYSRCVYRNFRQRPAAGSGAGPLAGSHPAASGTPGSRKISNWRGAVFQPIRPVRANPNGEGDHGIMEMKKGIFYGVGVGLETRSF